jgi:predicted O-methyltransferase YrrM
MRAPVSVPSARVLETGRRAVRAARSLARLRALPPRVAAFYARAERRARAAGDRFSLDSAARPEELGQLLRLARGRLRVAELGTGTAWTTVALALAEPRRTVMSFDPVARPERELYLALASPDALWRIRLEGVEGAAGAERSGDVDLLFVDSSHEREPTLAEIAAWRPHLAPGAVVAFHDWRHPDYPGVTEAVEELGLEGEELGGLFVWTAP